MSLSDLEAKIAHDLETLNYGRPNIVRPRTHPDGHVYDVLIVGGGQSGLGAAFALLSERMTNILVIDANPEGFEGPWETYARMRTLRTPKQLTGLDLGIPSLTFRAWYEAQYGLEAWEELDKISRSEWMRYLRWYRQVLELPVRNDTRTTQIEPLPGGIYRVHLEKGAPLLARKVVLATGIQGGGEWHIPEMMKALPRHLYAHTSEMIDFGAWRGKRIAILGGGASAFDNAATALDAGADEVQVFMRRREIPQVSPIPFLDQNGLLARFGSLDDRMRYIMTEQFLRLGQPPTNDMFDRAAAHPGFGLRLGCPWNGVREIDGKVEISTPEGLEYFDFAVLSTGLVTDPRLRPELSLVSDKIRLWGDLDLDVGEYKSALVDSHPYLSPAFSYTAKDPNDSAMAAAVGGIFPFNFSALVNFSLVASGLAALSYGLKRLVAGLSDQFLREDVNELFADYLAYDEKTCEFDVSRFVRSPQAVDG
ncbi:NAD(P)-binding domain-containing protein [Novosphingobium pentaromativorans]|uniref:Oxidoreductase n=1 Tax=Novosphingobium pentaromativorans US6-1 TaxID=1088721 RepID=G6EA78_9SPHN|nr:NAD(P)/FAD-dependent oxidoreductase [Novosphingobium pentaromativorans]AIT80780.1 monooxygenase [Novosphingobium pentaromativorans US6-1]EHJ61793.1 oxidoreductase [Novosphingobium pentaromativorans US6-1]